MSRFSRRFAQLMCVAGLFLLCLTTAQAGSRAETRPITRLKFDPTAESVELFEGMEAGQLEARVVHRDALGGSLLIKNTTEEPLTIEMPDAFVAVQVNKQFGANDDGGDDGGGAQTTGGGGGGGGGGGFGGAQGGQGGQGFFSIPPERTVRLPYQSVCLEHGKKEPSPRMRYEIRPVESFTNDPVLTEMISMVGTGKLDPQSAQAAAWHQSNNISWSQLARKTRKLRGGRRVPWFRPQDLQKGQMILANATARARERAQETDEESPAKPIRTSVRVR